MTQYDAAPRRGIGLKAPITGLVLVGLVVYGTYWGWDRAFGDDTAEQPVAGACPTPSATTTGAPTTGAATTPAALSDADSAGTSLGSAVVALAGQALDAGLLVAADTVPVAATTTTTPAPTATQLYVQPGGVLVNVINATARRGLAANTAAVLRDRGFAVQSIGNAPADDLVAEVAQIRAPSVTNPQALLLLQHVPGAVIVADGRIDATIDLVLGDAFSALGDPTIVTPVPLPSSTC